MLGSFRVLAIGTAAALAGCGAVGDLNPFGEKDIILTGDRTTVFSTNSPMLDQGAVRAANVAPPRTNADWPQPGGNAQNAPGHVAFSGSASRAWRANVGGRNLGITRGSMRIAAKPVVAGGKVFVYAPDGSVTALSASGGSRLWRTSLRPENERDSTFGGGVAVDGSRVFVATGYGEVAALDAADGSVVWKQDLETPMRGAPTAADGKVFVVNQKNEVFALNQSDGTQAFTYAGIPEQAGLVAAASPAVSGGKVVIPYSSGEVMAFSTASGEAEWQSFVTRPQRTMGIASLSDISGSPVIADGVVYATSLAGRTIAVTLSSGETRWTQDIGSASTPVVSGNAVFLVDLSDRMVALERTTGEPLWMTELPKPKRRRDQAYAGPVLAGGALWAISDDGRLARIDPGNGQLVSDRNIGSAGFTSPIVADGQMIVVSDAGEVSALR